MHERDSCLNCIALVSKTKNGNGRQDSIGEMRTVSSCIGCVEAIFREQWELVLRNAHIELERGACNEWRELLRLCMNSGVVSEMR